jgi:hypothetical protein
MLNRRILLSLLLATASAYGDGLTDIKQSCSMANTRSTSAFLARMSLRIISEGLKPGAASLRFRASPNPCAGGTDQRRGA